jgi:hypothetical protein
MTFQASPESRTFDYTANWRQQCVGPNEAFQNGFWASLIERFKP